MDIKIIKSNRKTLSLSVDDDMCAVVKATYFVSSGGSLAGAKLYVSLFPCNECAKAIIQAGIKEVIYDCDKYADTPSVIASKRMMDAAGVRYHQYHRTNRKIEIEL